MTHRGRKQGRCPLLCGCPAECQCTRGERIGPDSRARSVVREPSSATRRTLVRHMPRPPCQGVVAGATDLVFAFGWSAVDCGALPRRRSSSRSTAIAASRRVADFVKTATNATVLIRVC